MFRSAAAALCIVLSLFSFTIKAFAATATLRSVPGSTTLTDPRSPGVQGRAEATLLGVRINGIDQDDAVMALQLASGSIAVPVDALSAWHLRLPSTTLLHADGRDHVELGAIAGLVWRIDAASQTLVIDVPPQAFLRNGFEVASLPPPVQAQSAVGGFANYDIRWQRDGAIPTQTFSGLVEAGFFSPSGNGRASGFWRTGGNTPSVFTRLDTNWNIDTPDTMSSLRFGDAISSPGAWGRSVRFGGFQWATNFAVRPGFVSFPMPSIRGEAAVPSIVDLYVNNNHQAQGNVPPGAFDLPDVPVVTGQGQIKMVVRDLLGREQVVVQPYYVSPTLLRPGLHDFAVEAGFVRENYALDSWRYGRALVSLTDRVGVTPEFTRELHAEMLRDQQSVGASGAWVVQQEATANLAAAVSRGPGGTGWLVAGGIDRQAKHWSTNLQASATSRDFAQVGQASSLVGAPRNTIGAGMAASSGDLGASINLLQQATWSGDVFRSLSLNLSSSLGTLGYLGVYATRSGGSASGTLIGVNFIHALDLRNTATIGATRNRERGAAPSAGAHETTQQTLQLQGSPPAGPGTSYRLLADGGSSSRVSAEGAWMGDRIEVDGGIGQAHGVDALRAGVSGGVALMPEGVFLSRRIDGSFAVVQVGGYEGVRINRDNHFVARTDDQGRAFVGGLRGFESNRISVEEGDLPLDAEVDNLHVTVSPGMGSGVSVLFPVRRTRAATLRLVLADGSPVPPGSQVRIDEQTREFPVGFDGRIFLAGLTDHSRLAVAWPERECSAQIEAPPDPDDVPDLGTQVCQ